MKQTGLKPEDILFRNSDLLGINKPVGVAMHGSRILEDRAVALLTMARRHEGRMVHLIHRLDRPVSGVVLFARNHDALVEMSQAFENRQVSKCYLAVVRGWTDPDGVISHPLYPPRDERKPGSASREAVSRYQRIARTEIPFPVHPYPASRYSLLALYPETGRRHQLRRHMKHISHHLIGDSTYGRGEHNRLFREQMDCHRLLLHAWSLEFSLATGGRKIRIQAPLDQQFKRVTEWLGWKKELDSWLSERW